MGRSKEDARRRSLIASRFRQVSRNGPADDPAEGLLDYFSRIPVSRSQQSDDSASNSEADERPKKRLCLATRSNQPTTIAQHEFLLYATDETIRPNCDYGLRRDVGRFLKISMTGFSNVTRCLPDDLDRLGDIVLCSQYGSQIGTLKPVKPRHGTSLTPGLVAAIQLANALSSDPEVDDALWVAIDAEVLELDGEPCMRLVLRVTWNENTKGLSNHLPKQLRIPKETYLGNAVGADKTTWDSQISWGPQDFYEAAFVPDKETLDSRIASMQIPELAATLYPFQKRAVHWLLEREGQTWVESDDGDGSHIRPVADKRLSERPLSFYEWKHAKGERIYVSSLFGVITRDLTPYRDLEESLKGGVLAEEMGLGKTLEITALVALHRRPLDPAALANSSVADELRPTGATLIIAPVSLLPQWLSELERHAPSQRVLHYAGLKSMSKQKKTEQDMINLFVESDIVVTTYEVLRGDFHSAIDPPGRNMRGEKKYERLKSPLVQMSWWRVCIDEAQMVENFATKTAITARLIPRVNAWSITGTPVKDDIRKDLRGLLVFLHYEPFASSADVWNRLTSGYKADFKRLFRRISMRHTKSLVRSEIALPPQKRYVITMPFSAVEEQHYQELFRELVERCGLDTEGNPLLGDWDPEHTGVVESMRAALDRLRQTALHPEVGPRNRRALGNRNGPIRTVAEVLDAMLEQSDIDVRFEQRVLFSAQLTKGQLLEESPRVKEALAIWQNVRKECEKVVSELRSDLQLAIEEAKKTGVAEQEATAGSADEAEDDDQASGKVGDARRRLRSALEVLHRAVFFCANGFHQIKTNKDMTVPDSDEFQALEKMETETYEDAKAIRREILRETLRRATLLRRKMAERAEGQQFADIPDLAETQSSGIECRSIIGGLNELYQFLNEQADQLDQWREDVIQLLCKPMVDEDDTAEITGEEYEDSTKQQEEIMVRVQVLRALVHDRQEALSGQKNNLVEHERRQAINMAKDGEGPYPDKLLELFGVRDALNQGNPAISPSKRSLRAVLTELRVLSGKLRFEATGGSSRAELELEIVAEHIKAIMADMSEQSKMALALEQEVEQFTNAMNARVEFYRQFQSISDMVAKFGEEKDEVAMERLEKLEKDTGDKLRKVEAKHRYLVHLKETDSASAESRTCVICRSTFSLGVLTVCGHQFCKECMELWYRAHHNCPICKRQLHASSIHNITLKAQELKVHSDHTPSTGNGPETRSPTKYKKSTIYADFDPQQLAEIKTIELAGPSFTTKVDTLVRHLLWLREADPGAKSIVFSQYQEFVAVLRLACTRHRIGFAHISDAGGTARFRDDPAVEVFLLHARAHSSGLNLVNASHVFLCEPLLNTALELQAIARVDRIGQRAQETTVWLYIVDGTVEESIYELSVQRRMKHMGRRDNKGKGVSGNSTPELLDASLEAANSLELQQASLSRLMGKGPAAGERVAQSDLWQCLFGHVARGRALTRGEDDEQLRNNPAIRSFLAAEAAEARATAG